MEWRGGRQGGDVEDRRGLGPVHYVGGGLGALVLAAAGYFFFGISPSTTLQAVNAVQGGQAQQQQGVVGTPTDEQGQFVDIIASSADDVWSGLVPNYSRPKVVLYDSETPTACGDGQSAMGPFYCPNDKTVYLDLSFWSQLETQFGAKGDFAKAYVIAHEIGHHVQNLTGQMDRAQGLSQQGANSGSVRLELQADCYAGVWAAHVGAATGGKVTLDAGDIEDGMAAASGVGDDTLQRAAGGRVAPDSFTHGTSAQRVKWLRRGYDSGQMSNCDTFSGAI